MVQLILFLSVTIILVCTVQGSNILMVFSLPSKSHHILGSSLARGLMRSGHDITMITLFSEKITEQNGTYRTVAIDDDELNILKNTSVNYFDLETANPMVNIPFMNDFGTSCSRNVFESIEVQKLLESNEKFDVIISEALFTDSLTVFGCHFDAPVILLNPMGKATWINNVLGNFAPPSYIPCTFLKLNEDMNFLERSKNAAMELLVKLNLELWFYPSQDTMIKKYFPHCPGIQQLHKNVALILSNSHESINSAAPKVPNMIDIGGYHISEGKKLPRELQKLLDNAKNGVVYFSLGSYLRPSQMSEPTKQAIIKVLGSLKQTVIWKFDEDDLPGKPTNMVLGKWFPQQQLLAHPNVKLFITHAGLLSMTEAVYLGVPILALPILADQKLNAAKAFTLGIGKYLSFSHLTEENFRDAVTEIINNPKYTKNVKYRSALLRDRPIKPLDLAVYWVEYVIRHRGASHLRVFGAKLPWYQYFLVDVVIFWSTISLIFVISFVKLITKFCCKASKRKLKNL